MEYRKERLKASGLSWRWLQSSRQVMLTAWNRTRTRGWKKSEQNIKYLRGKTTACGQGMKYRKRSYCPEPMTGYLLILFL